ncbi:hypothetical protein EGR_10633 [Echinococcus granulosus]|uniref:Uncharacterized protein n=1 Tax=Echinococcus granulosus TaxID=6210 RepID=W6U089_ECHGR|nr:hypothetical protein EGR_10633 [Echinococcus granulosus]EUB54510.1 hypothetical protein EGR_10633 [Echinococcus granulosus]
MVTAGALSECQGSEVTGSWGCCLHFLEKLEVEKESALINSHHSSAVSDLTQLWQSTSPVRLHGILSATLLLRYLYHTGGLNAGLFKLPAEQTSKSSSMEIIWFHSSAFPV